MLPSLYGHPRWRDRHRRLHWRGALAQWRLAPSRRRTFASCGSSTIRSAGGPRFPEADATAIGEGTLSLVGTSYFGVPWTSIIGADSDAPRCPPRQ